MCFGYYPVNIHISTPLTYPLSKDLGNPSFTSLMTISRPHAMCDQQTSDFEASTSASFVTNLKICTEDLNMDHDQASDYDAMNQPLCIFDISHAEWDRTWSKSRFSHHRLLSSTCLPLVSLAKGLGADTRAKRLRSLDFGNRKPMFVC